MNLVCAKCKGLTASGTSVALRPKAMNHHMVCYPCYRKIVSTRVKKGTATKFDLDYFEEVMKGIHPKRIRKKKESV